MKRWLFIIFLPLFAQAARGPSDPVPSSWTPIFPSSDVWNIPVNNLAVSSNSGSWIANSNGTSLHPNFGTQYLGYWNGVPYNIVCGGVTPNVSVVWNSTTNYSYQSATIPVSGLPIPQDAILESDATSQITTPYNQTGDQHLILVDTCTPILYEMFMASRTNAWSGPGTNYTGSWNIQQLSTWTITVPDYWPNTWTTSNAGGTPEMNGLVNWNEVNSGVINHALQIATNFTYGYIWPGRHSTTTGGSSDPPLGMRVVLVSTFNISGYSATNQVILKALQTYGAILTDNAGAGSVWLLQGSPNLNWNDSDLHNLTAIIPSSAFVAVDESRWEINPNSGQANTQTVSEIISGNAKLTGKGILH